jgi:hypothetical protein
MKLRTHGAYLTRFLKIANEASYVELSKSVWYFLLNVSCGSNGG